MRGPSLFTGGLAHGKLELRPTQSGREDSLMLLERLADFLMPLSKSEDDTKLVTAGFCSVTYSFWWVETDHEPSASNERLARPATA